MHFRGLVFMVAALAGLLVPVGPERSAAAAPLVGLTTTSVQAGTRILLANGQPLTVKGYNHFPNAVGEFSLADPYADPALCRRDGALLRGAGATAVRIWLNFARQPGMPTITACADGFAAEGIGVIWTIGQPLGVPTDPGFREQFEEYIARSISALGTHPATFMWLIGNEIELIAGCESAACRSTWFGQPGGATGMLHHLAAYAKARDSAHLVGTSLSGVQCFGFIGQQNAPAIEVWGMNAYPNPPDLGTLCGTNFFARLNALDPRPKFFTELGTDRFRCTPSVVESSSGYVASCNPATSGEDAAGQADWLARIWDSMTASLAGPTNPSGAVSGGTIFFFADAWENCTFFCVGSPANHEVAAYSALGGANAPDGNISVEWWGVAHAQPRGFVEPRVTTLSFDALARRWSAVAPPAITAGPTVSGPCELAVVRWTTSEPATTEVQFAEDGRRLDLAGQLVADDTIYRQVWHTQAKVTSHAVTLPIMWLGFRYRVVVRSFTADGRSVTANPVFRSC